LNDQHAYLALDDVAPGSGVLRDIAPVHAFDKWPAIPVVELLRTYF
jgi:hypothetical protein